VHCARSKKVKKGYVMSQSHRPGQKLAVNTKINLAVSRGKK
jgi:beta-lactam-binding protein with PASTA domain